MSPRKAFQVLMLLSLSLLVATTAFAQDEASMSISRLVTCTGIADREPVGAAESFSVDTGTVYAFMEANDISADVELSFVWLHEGDETARITLPIRQGGRWRTYSSKKLGGRTGAWRVEIQDPSGAVLSSVGFTVN
ncbi:MAG: DUF2914 domain-containing protein [Proteobacteria bacterium]|nr:DUF2914 domain-containing protein [Pseudomonadota bacterium]MBU1736666.1 DUF2914 domain-containing protein [Pseudomonadota bacterium]